MQICKRCVMNSTVPLTTFDENGLCSHCRDFDRDVRPRWHPGTEKSTRELQEQIERIKETQKDKEYDAIIGLSGGVDSSYLAYWAAKSAGLRLLAVHVDGGWNSELAVQNIEKIVTNLGIELYTHVVDWEAMRDVQLAFFRAGVANQDTPQDHAFFSALYEFAVKNEFEYVLHGSNIATEAYHCRTWGHDPMDADQITDICHKYRAKAFDRFPLVSFYDYFIRYPFIKRMKVVRPLNYINYKKFAAIETLERELGWKYYGGKHYESRFTRFFQGYWLPKKFGYDKRVGHLSSLINNGEITREEALKELESPSYDPKTTEADMEYIAKKLEISVDEFVRLMNEPNRTYRDFKHNTLKKRAFYKISAIVLRLWDLVKKLLRR